MRRIAIASHKGGVGKTTTAINLAVALAEQGRRVLVADMDPQGSVTLALGIAPWAPDRTLYEVLVKRSRPLADILVEGESGVVVAPSTETLSAGLAELPIANMTMAWQHVLADTLDTVKTLVDEIIIDTAPSLGALTVAGLVAADLVIIPTQLEVAAWRKAYELLHTIGEIRGADGRRPLNTGVRVFGVLPTFVDLRTRFANQSLAQLREEMPVPVLAPGVKRLIALHEATLAGQSILRYAPDSQAAEAYRTLAVEVIRAA